MKRFRRFRIRRLLPSPAMVVAVTALVLSLGGSAYALVITGKSIKNGSVTHKDIRDRNLSGREIRSDGIGGTAIKESSLGAVPVAFLAGGGTRLAVVNASGQAVRGRDISSTARTSAGRYQVIFNGNVRSCAYFATIADPSASAPPQNGQISVASLGSNVNGVAVRTENGTNGTELDRPFHLIVMC
jgi:hypothetical protein